jgi:hypothetical protein
MAFMIEETRETEIDGWDNEERECLVMILFLLVALLSLGGLL